jgi:excisionase family DNA binding protein
MAMTAAPVSPPYLTQEEVASLCRVSVQTLRRWRDRRQLPSPVKVGRRWLYKAEEVVEYMERQRSLPVAGEAAGEGQP